MVQARTRTMSASSNPIQSINVRVYPRFSVVPRVNKSLTVISFSFQGIFRISLLGFAKSLKESQARIGLAR
jgi:hypothetical protein